MVIGLVYTEVDGDADSRQELARVKRSLSLRARSVSRIRVRTSANPKTAYANKRGQSLLRSLQDTENALKAETEARKAETDALKAETKALIAEMRVLTREVTILRPLKETAVDIRKRFFAAFERSQGAPEEEYGPSIDSGNKKAHAGDVFLDICLFRHQLLKCDESFLSLYGLSWYEAETLIGYKLLVSAMNKRATVLTDRRLQWNFRKETAFRDLIKWIYDATAVELERFREDTDEDSYPQQLFKSIDS
ncbi:hypothetical protein HOY82DRAFT_575198 [Tuber indicum]|nr:hypothetical protein HOY82DRAFT_575198 [Tuber indicum]